MTSKEKGCIFFSKEDLNLPKTFTFDLPIVSPKTKAISPKTQSLRLKLATIRFETGTF
ncbi:hypothetical protein ACFE35_07045 [Phormidesmis priestleyi ANT.L61.2]